MTPRVSMIGRLAESRWMREARWRRGILLAIALVAGLLSIFPREYRAATTLTPSDAASVGLGGALGQLGAVAGLFSAQSAIEVNLKIIRSMDVRKLVARRLDLARTLGKSEVETDRWVEHNLDIRALRGGIIQIDAHGGDPDFLQRLVTTYADAGRAHLGELARLQTRYKRTILTKLIEDASEKLAIAQNAYDTFRRSSSLIEPGSALGAIGGRVPQLQEQIRSKQIELQGARKFATDQNMTIQRTLAEIQVLQSTLAQAKREENADQTGVNQVITRLTQLQKLQRNLQIAQGLYDSYTRLLMGTDVEDLTSNGSVFVLEPTYIDSNIQYRPLPLAIAALAILLLLAIEFYRARPPVGAMRYSA